MLTGSNRKSLRKWLAWLLLGSTSMTSLTGCSRTFWRQQADQDAYDATTEKLNNPHWDLPRIDLNPDPRSRFYDPYSQDCGPLPPDDPAAHQVMHLVSGRRGYKNWHKFGQALSIENPQWLEPFGVRVENADPVIGHSLVSLPEVSLPQSVELAYIHNRNYQTQIEDLYLSALDLTLERFQLGVRYLGVGGREPGASLLTDTNAEGRTDGSLSSNFGVSQLLPTGGQIAVELANSTLWVFGSPGTASASALSYSLTQPLLFNAGRKIALEPLTQAERNVLYAARVLARFRQTLFVDVAADYLQLLQTQQGILNTENNIRQLRMQLEASLAQDAYRPNVIKAPLAALPDGFQIPPELEGRLGFDPDGALIWRGPMTQEDEQLLLSLSDNVQYRGVIQDIITFASSETESLNSTQLRSQLNQRINALANTRRGFADALDAFKVNLGLPPNIDLGIQVDLLRPFELISGDLIRTEAEFRAIQEEFGERLLPKEGDAGEAPTVDLPILQQYVGRLIALKDQLYLVGLEGVQSDFAELRDILQFTQDDWSAFEPGLRFFLSEDERNGVIQGIDQDLRLFRLSERDYAITSAPLDMLESIIEGDTEQDLLRRLDQNGNGLIELSELPPEFAGLPTIQAQSGGTNAQADENAQVVAGQMTVQQLLARVRDAATTLREDLQRVAQSLQVVQAGVRVETIPLNRFALEGSQESPDIEEVVRLGLENRHDLMNARAAVMDARRRVEIAANRLEAALDIEFSGRQALSAGGPNASNYSAGLRFTSPLDMVTERNLYREALITYQRQRRTYMQLEDLVKTEIRRAWRQLEVQQERLSVDRANVRTVARNYDAASLRALGGTSNASALDVLQALNNVLDAQNSLVGDWVTYETNRLNIFRDMGIMEIDPRGLWVDRFYLLMDDPANSEVPGLPPQVPDVTVPAPESP